MYLKIYIFHPFPLLLGCRNGAASHSLHPGEHHKKHAKELIMFKKKKKNTKLPRKK